MTTINPIHTEMLVLIPARGGSKRLPHKNTRLLMSKPLIAYAIEAALDAGVGRVVVSTDDVSIADVAVQFGASVPFLRPPELAGDDTLSVDVALHCLNALRPMQFDAVVLVQPTSPLRISNDIVECVRLYLDRQADAVISVCHLGHNPRAIVRLTHNHCIQQVHSADAVLPDEYYVINGSVYVIKCAVLEEQRTFFPTRTIPYIMPNDRSVDIDTFEDFQIAERLLQTAGPQRGFEHD